MHKHALSQNQVEAELLLEDSDVAKTHAQIADTLAFLKSKNVPPAQLQSITGFKPHTVRHYIRIANKLVAPVMKLLHEGKLTFSMARAIASFPGDTQEEQARSVIQKKTSVSRFRAMNKEDSLFTDDSVRKHYERVARLISEQTGLDVEILPDLNNNRNGEFKIRYVGHDSFDAVCSQLGGDLSDL